MPLELPDDLRRYLSEPDAFGREVETITEKDLSNFEADRDVRLPQDYRDYCLTYGSRTLQSKKIFCFKTKVLFPSGKSKQADIGSISGPPYIAETYDRYMDPIYNNSGPRLPKKYFPFTFDSGYGHCLMDLTDEGKGRILYIVIKAKTFGDAGYGWDQVGTVASSFQEFLLGLKPDFL